MKYFKEVKGLMSNIETMRHYEVPVVVQVTADKRGATLSLGFVNYMISIPLESVSDVLKIKGGNK